MRGSKSLFIYAADLETDPFKINRIPKPFCSNVFDGNNHYSFWGGDCVAQMMSALHELPPGIVYFHNGGRFDIFYLLDYIDETKPILVIKNRITRAYIKCRDGWHEIRDSYKILPFPLSAYKKDEVDYTLFERNKRDKHKETIIDYLKGDCLYLWQLCAQFIRTFGNSVTIGGVAFRELKKFHDTGERLDEQTDEYLRDNYYYGARVERYHTGVFEKDFKVYDVNSMYPYVMAHYQHPVGYPIFRHRSNCQITPDTFFITAKGRNRGAFPKRTKSGINFNIDYGVFSVTIHEWIAAQQLGLFDCHELIETVDFEQHDTFANFIFHFYNQRVQAKENGDDIMYLFFKYLLNNSYGRFALNPRNYKDYAITASWEELNLTGWQPVMVMTDFNKTMWERPATNVNFYNVSTGASITGAARSVLMRAIPFAKGLMYCDTDSLICESLNGVTISDTELGGWKLEKQGNRLAVAGKKMYALFDDNRRGKPCIKGCVHYPRSKAEENEPCDGCLKYACKGVDITPDEVVEVARGKRITYRRDAPTFTLDGNVNFIQREVRIR